MKRFEYYALTYPFEWVEGKSAEFEEVCDSLGSKGWELVSVHMEKGPIPRGPAMYLDCYCFFKREQDG